MADNTPEVLLMSPVVGIVIKRPYILRYSSAIKINRRLITFYSWQYQVNYITTVTILHVLSSNHQVLYTTISARSSPRYMVPLVLYRERNTVTSIFGQQHISICSNWPLFMITLRLQLNLHLLLNPEWLGET